MTLAPDARTPSADLHTLTGSTPPGVVAELPDTFAPLGAGANGVVAGLAARRTMAHPDAKVIFLAERVAALAPVTSRVSGRLAEQEDAADAKSPALPRRPEPENRTKVSNVSTEGWYIATFSYPTTPDEAHTAAMKAYDAEVAEVKRAAAAMRVRHRVPQWQALDRRTHRRLIRRAWRLTYMRPQTQDGLKAKAAASVAVMQTGISDVWANELHASISRDALRIISAGADARYRADQDRDGELLALGRAWRDCAERHEQAIVLRDEAEHRMIEREWPAVLCFEPKVDPSVLAPYTVQHAPTDQRRFAFPAIDRLRRAWPHDFCRARRDEILAAYDAWMAQQKSDKEAAGLSAAESALWQACEENAALRRRILAIPARTAAGAMLKVEVACWCMGDVAGMEVDLAGHVDTGKADDEAFACGALLDVTRVLGCSRWAVAEDLRSTALPAASAA